MDAASFVFAAALVAAPAGLVWEELVRRHEDKMAKRRMCDHYSERRDWSKAGTFDLVEFCARGCGAQRHVNRDGTPRGDWH